jgi:hypothetical protein
MNSRPVTVLAVFAAAVLTIGLTTCGGVTSEQNSVPIPSEAQGPARTSPPTFPLIRRLMTTAACYANRTA